MFSMKSYCKLITTLILLMMLSACGGGDASTGNSTSTDSGDGSNAVKPVKNATILVFGDSLSAGYGITGDGTYFQYVTPGNAWAELLQKRILNEKLNEYASLNVVNASLGGEFTASALSSLINIYKPTHILLAHATNDVLSGLPMSNISNRLESMVQISQNSGAKVLMLDITFAYYGIEFANEYSKLFKDLSVKYNSTYVPVLDTIFENPTYYAPDYIHLNDLAQPIMTENVWKKLIPLLE